MADPDTDTDTDAGLAARWWRSALALIGLPRQRASADHRERIERELFERVQLRGPVARNFAVLGVLSSAIAAMGLLLDSAPAVIGAMLLGPFIVPLLAISGSLVQGWGHRLGRAAAMVALGVTASVASAFVIGIVFGAQLESEVLPSQLLALTRPGLLDLGIALVAGIAAGYATMRTEAAGSLSGVAVSVTLEPPLAAMGLFLASGQSGDLRQAALAFVTNFGALVLGATFAMAWWGYGEQQRSDDRRQAGVGLVAWIVLVVAIAVPLAVYSQRAVRNTQFEREVSTVVRDWDPSVRLVDVDAAIGARTAVVAIEITGPRQPEPAWRLAELLTELRGVRVDVTVTFTLTREDRAVSTD